MLLLQVGRLWIRSHIIVVTAIPGEDTGSAEPPAARLISWHSILIITILRMKSKANRTLKQTLGSFATIAIMATDTTTTAAFLGEKSTREVNPGHRMADAIAFAQEAKVRDRAYANFNTRHRRGVCSTDRPRRSRTQKRYT